MSDGEGSADAGPPGEPAEGRSADGRRSPGEPADGAAAGTAGSTADGAAPEYGDAWTYESIVGALPGVALPDRVAVAVQLVGFEALVLALSWWYGLPDAALAGTVAVLVAAGGSVTMRRMGDRIRAAHVPPAYARAVFGSSIEVVLALLAFVALVVYLFVVDPADGTSLLATLAGDPPPAPVVYVGLVVAWDVCYRIGTSWWACVVGAWRSWRFDFDPATARELRGVDRLNVVFALLQLALAPLLVGHPVLLVAVVGHVAAVLLVAGLSTALLWER